MKESLWKAIIILQKYVAPTSLLDWIRNPQKSIQECYKSLEGHGIGLSCHWKLSYMEGWQWEECKDWLRIIMGCGEHIFLSPNLINHLYKKGIFTLHQIVDTNPTNVWLQDWKLAQSINLGGEWMDSWQIYLNELKRVHIRIRDSEDSLMWAKNKVTGMYTTKLSYEALMDAVGQEEVWWWNKIWKIKVPKKTRIFLWLTLKNKVPTWEGLQKRGRQGPNICLLCMRDVETISHLVIHCPYAQHLRKDLEKMTGMDNVWRDTTVQECLKAWFQKKKLNFFRTIPCLTIWGIWSTRNARIFEGKQIPTFQVYNQICGLFHGCKSTSKMRQPEQVDDLYIDKSLPWDFFDGVRQGQDNLSNT
jgi:hypothetical protein